jgi:hypothetical protein
MKSKIFLSLSIIYLSITLCAKDIKTDELMWAEAYKGNFSIVHKLLLTRLPRGFNDEMASQFIMAYVYYRMGKPEEILPIFEGIDSCIEAYLDPRSDNVLE